MLIALLIVAVWARGGMGIVQNANLFAKFKRDFGKEYETFEEEKKRFKIFVQNIEVVEKLNFENPDTTYGINKFMDITSDEFREKYLMSKPFDPVSFREGIREEATEYMDVNNIPTSWNWADKGVVTEVKNQGQCESCWAFSSIASIESMYAIKTKKLISLSEQQLVSCDPKYTGECKIGFNMVDAWQYVINNGGVESEKEYPYTSGKGEVASCQFQSYKVNVTISSFVGISHDEEKMASWLYQNGPISVGLNADQLQHYVSGVFDPLLCTKPPNHAVFITGYGVTSSDDSNRAKDYWIVKNSYGKGWGMDGYFWIIRGKGKCSINTMPCSAIV